MSELISDYTQLGFYNFERSGIVDPAEPGDMIRFGIQHNFLNNFQATIEQCSGSDCEAGDVKIDVKHVQQTIKRYFGYDYADLKSVTSSDPPYILKGRYYLFAASDGEEVYPAKVETAQKTPDGDVEASGVLYNFNDEDEINADFTAVLKPIKWEGKDTRRAESLTSKFRPGK
jgi:hypothetical protein